MRDYFAGPSDGRSGCDEFPVVASASVRKEAIKRRAVEPVYCSESTIVSGPHKEIPRFKKRARNVTRHESRTGKQS